MLKIEAIIALRKLWVNNATHCFALHLFQDRNLTPMVWSCAQSPRNTMGFLAVWQFACLGALHRASNYT